MALPTTVLRCMCMDRTRGRCGGGGSDITVLYYHVRSHLYQAEDNQTGRSTGHCMFYVLLRKRATHSQHWMTMVRVAV